MTATKAAAFLRRKNNGLRLARVTRKENVVTCRVDFATAQLNSLPSDHHNFVRGVIWGKLRGAGFKISDSSSRLARGLGTSAFFCTFEF